jgi:hypothetical protein
MIEGEVEELKKRTSRGGEVDGSNKPLKSGDSPIGVIRNVFFGRDVNHLETTHKAEKALEGFKGKVIVFFSFLFSARFNLMSICVSNERE